MFPVPACRVCGGDSALCEVNERHSTKAILANRAAVRRWRARMRAAEDILRGAVSVEER